MGAQGKTMVQALFGVLALGAGLYGGWYAYDQTSSWWLAAFVFLMASAVVGRGIPDVITDSDKGKRAMFFGLPPLIATGALAGAYALWETWWSAVVIGFVAYVIGYAISTVAFPAIAADEEEDSVTRMGGGTRPTSAGPASPARPVEMDHEMVESLADAGVAQGRLSPADRDRFVFLMEAGRIQEATELIGDEGRTPAVTVGKYGNTMF